MVDDDGPEPTTSEADAAVRRSRFGELPARIAPEGWLQEIETDPPHELEQSIPIVQHPGRVTET